MSHIYLQDTSYPDGLSSAMRLLSQNVKSLKTFVQTTSNRYSYNISLWPKEDLSHLRNLFFITKGILFSLMSFKEVRSIMHEIENSLDTLYDNIGEYW